MSLRDAREVAVWLAGDIASALLIKFGETVPTVDRHLPREASWRQVIETREVA